MREDILSSSSGKAEDGNPKAEGSNPVEGNFFALLVSLTETFND